MEVLVRRSRHRLAKVMDRLEVLEGYLKAFLDLDEVIRIIREEDEPKPALMARFELTDRQAEAILNLRLRNLRKLEEMELAAERAELVRRARRRLEALLADEGLRRARLKEQFLAARKQFGGGALGKRRTEPRRGAGDRARAARGAGRALPGHDRLLEAGLDPRRRAARSRTRPSSSTRRATASASSCRRRAATGCWSSPPTAGSTRWRSTSSPAAAAMASRCRWRSTSRRASRSSTCASTAPTAGWCSRPARASASSPRRQEIAAQTRAGRQVVNLSAGDTLLAAVPVEGDHLAVAGTNRKLLIFPRGRAAGPGARQGGHADAAQGCRARRPAHARSRDRPEPGPPTAASAGCTDLTGWRGPRAGAGRMAPNGFPRNNRFG